MEQRMATELVYLEDTYKFTYKAQVEYLANDERGQYCILDQTIFYPQGGGQPSDTGFFEAKGVQMPISFVTFVEGEVRHYGDFSETLLEKGEEVLLFVDEDRRITNAKAHTSGHLLADVVESLGKGVIAFKGYHFPDGSYVEFQGNIPPEESESFISEVNNRLREILSSGGNIQASLVMLEDLKALCSNIRTNLPPDKPMRVVTMGAFQPTPCGGTHLKSLSELKEIAVTKIKRLKGNTKISYRFA
ncbi:alanine--tRNA ligase-related protein [Microcoleus sp. B4-D4]|uniref:alanine--tRNA ligase-related protein n=1 Tax=Microcoleus sp. B4-D4 TaxID=2818667 RepID=UPI002FD79427